MTGTDYQNEAMRTINKDSHENLNKIIDNENGLVAGLLESCLGLSGESGEFCDIVKKWLFQGHMLDKAHLKSELGDILWYVALACNHLQINMDDLMEMNLMKLQKRYPKGFVAEKSINRDNGDI